MKPLTTILFSAILFIAFNAYSQFEAGVIKYEFRVDLHRNIPPGREALKTMIPQFAESNFKLLFNNHESFYSIVEDADADPRSQGMGRGMRMAIPRSETYVNREEMEIIAAQEFMGNTYLITEDLGLGPWRMGDEILEIAGYNCMMAWYNDTILNQEVTAWFTMELPPFLGPDNYVSLPGTVLAVDINNGERVWVARKITSEVPADIEISKPSRGQKVTREEYSKMMREFMERMNRQGGGPGRF